MVDRSPFVVVANRLPVDEVTTDTPGGRVTGSGDSRRRWRRSPGGLVTALLFALGKWVIAFYLSRGDVGGAYGAAGSLVVLLVWVYYSSAIFFFGAEVVRAWFREHGQHIEPAQHALQTDTSG